jgi:hypothetical protein
MFLMMLSRSSCVAAVVLEEESNQSGKNGPYKKRATSSTRRLFDTNIKIDYLGDRTLFNGELHKPFRLSRSMVELIIMILV